MSNKTITVISQNSGLIHDIQNLVSTPVSLITSLSDLWTSLSTNPANIQLVVLDLKHFANSNLQVFDLSTLLNIMSRANNCAPILAAWVTPDLDPLLIKQLEDADVQGLIPCGSWLGLEATVDALDVLMSGQKHWPRKLMDHFSHKQKPGVKKTSTPQLTPRQAQVMHLIATRGASNKVIARSLKISESTVKVHIGAILKKFGVRNRTQLALCSVNGKL